jgi:RimJ/RimL family protein N-acetyltransferase
MSTARCPPAADPGACPRGEPVEIEPLRPGDERTVLQVFDELGPRSRELRFLTPKPRLTGVDLAALADVDGDRRVALVARGFDGRPIGIARFVRDDQEPSTAEAAVAVVDAWQHQGVGTRLAKALADRARSLGVTRISVVMAHDNEGAARLMHRITDDVTRLGITSGAVGFEIPLITRGRRGPSALKGVPR